MEPYSWVVMSLTLAVCTEVNDDPHLWLEEVTGDKALAWVKDRNAEEHSHVDGEQRVPALS